MTSNVEPIQPPVPPRPGVLVALGVINIGVSIFLSGCVAFSTLWLLFLPKAGTGSTLTFGPGPAAVAAPLPQPPPKPVEVPEKRVAPRSPDAKATPAPPAPADPAPAPPAPPPPPVAGGGTLQISIGGSMTSNEASMFGTQDPLFVGFCYLDLFTALPLNLIMFVTGIGLINRRRWGAQGWRTVAWIKIARLVLLWGFFAIAVAPVVSEGMTKGLLSLMEAQRTATTKMPSPAQVAQIGRIYTVTLAVMALVMMGLGSIYPAVSLWILGRRGVRAALIGGGKPASRSEAELS